MFLLRNSSWNGFLSLLCAVAFGFPCDAEAGSKLPSVLTDTVPEGEFGAQDVSEAQQLLVNADTEADGLEQLGWAFIEKARHHDQTGYYARAMACAEALESRHPGRKLDGQLIRGHVLHQEHQFKKALRLAVELSSKRGNSFDQGLLGDVLLDLGQVDRASGAYQKMLDLRPGLSSYLRAAEMRWLKGDPQGAVDASLLALKAGSKRQPAPLAWAYTRMSYFLVGQGRLSESQAAADRALDLLPAYGPALAAKGRAMLADGDAEAAVELLGDTQTLHPEPLTWWTAWECARKAGKVSQSQALQKKILTRGIQIDPRSVSLYLATINRNSEVALQLAESEMQVRQDIYTQDALAFALLRHSQSLEESTPAKAASLLSRAQTAIELALIHETKDPRLWLHAGLIYQAAGKTSIAHDYLKRASASPHLLYPSEHDLLASALNNPSRSLSQDQP